ncbi:MAG: hypothetical protein KBB21_33655 [Nannocystaceae bacterium]|nr:hypothetical protein [Deltaproteobacteria bacterium]MBP7291624.1 hypothetical protein [Nannocystaceae bacterium]
MLRRLRLAALERAALLSTWTIACTPAAGPSAAEAPVAAAMPAAPTPVDAAPSSVTPATATTSAPTELTLVNLAPGSFALKADAAIGLRTVARLERRDDQGHWQPLTGLDLGQGYRLIASCDERPGACIELAAGAELRPVAFSGMGCSSQCNQECDKNVFMGPATLRLSVDTCDGRTLDGPAFELPSTGGGEHLARVGLATGLLTGEAVRMHEPNAAEDRVGKTRIFEWRTREDTRRGLSPTQLTTLATLLADPSGYDDQILKRCRMGELVGFTLTQRLASTGAEVELRHDLLVDLHCNKIFFGPAGGHGDAAITHASHFDASHPAWLAFVRDVFPGDRALARVK